MSALVDGAGKSNDVQSPRVDRREELRSTDVDLSELLGILVAACKSADIGPEKLAIEMECDKSYPSRVLRGEKPLTLPFLHRCPAEVKDSFAALYAESRGFIVVRPVPFEVAMHHLLSGLFGVLAPRESSKRFDSGPARMARGVVRSPVVESKVG